MVDKKLLKEWAKDVLELLESPILPTNSRALLIKLNKMLEACGTNSFYVAPKEVKHLAITYILFLLSQAVTPPESMIALLSPSDDLVFAKTKSSDELTELQLAVKLSYETAKKILESQ